MYNLPHIRILETENEFPFWDIRTHDNFFNKVLENVSIATQIPIELLMVDYTRIKPERRSETTEEHKQQQKGFNM